MKGRFTTVTIHTKLQQKLKRIAEENKRSMHQQLAVIIEEWEKVLDKNKNRT